MGVDGGHKKSVFFVIDRFSSFYGRAYQLRYALGSGGGGGLLRTQCHTWQGLPPRMLASLLDSEYPRALLPSFSLFLVAIRLQFSSSCTYLLCRSANHRDAEVVVRVIVIIVVVVVIPSFSDKVGVVVHQARPSKKKKTGHRTRDTKRLAWVGASSSQNEGIAKKNDSGLAGHWHLSTPTT